MVKQAVRILTIVLAFLAIGGFLAIYGNEIHKAWPSQKHSLENQQPSANQDQTIDDPYSYVATALAGLVGAVVAVMFGRPAPQVSATRTADAALDWAAILSIIYAWSYVLAGVTALITWVMNKNVPILVRTLAMSFLGLLIPVVTAYLRPDAIVALLRNTREV